jgi:hypothetical protein
MAIIGEPQRTYLHKRHKKAYNIKYSIYELISKQINPQARILEMFGGIGINTYFLMKNANPKLLRIYEIDSVCANFLKDTYKDNANVEVIEGDCFNECEDFDYIYIDGSNFSASNLSQYIPIFNMLSKMTGQVFITDSGYFKFRYMKPDKRDKAIQEYYENYDKVFNTYGMSLGTVYEGNEFAVLSLAKGLNNSLTYWKYTNETVEWKKVTTKYDSFIWNYDSFIWNKEN